MTGENEIVPSIPGGKEKIEPRPTAAFFLRNIGMLLRMRLASRRSAERQQDRTRRLPAALIPDFEGTGGPMEEGMIYLNFNARDGAGPMDSAFRVFWVNSPDLRFSFFDSFLVSNVLESGQWDRTFPASILKNRSKRRYHQEVDLPDFRMNCDGTWQSGYRFEFEDRRLRLSGRVDLRPRPGGVLTYFNGRRAVSPTMAQRFFDMFALDASGELEAQGRRVRLDAGTAILEHGLGVFSNFSIEDWRWLNLTWPGGAAHLFYYTVDFPGEGILAGGEGAALVDGRWCHFLANDFSIDEVAYAPDAGVPTKVPVRWRVRAGLPGEPPLLDLDMEKTASLSWIGAMGKPNEFISNYVLSARGSFQGRPVEARGTMENQMHRVID